MKTPLVLHNKIYQKQGPNYTKSSTPLSWKFPNKHQNNLLTTTPKPYKSSTNTQNQPNVNVENYQLEMIMGMESSGVGLQFHHHVFGKPLHNVGGLATTAQPTLSLSVWFG
jgi:hypothetical protein